MSRKRLEKKRRSEDDAWKRRLDELVAAGEDEAFLASVRRRWPRPLESPVSPRYSEVRERLLNEALADGDLDRLEKEALRAERTGPAGELASTVAHLLAGRDEAARESLKPLRAGSPLPPALGNVADLLATLAGEDAWTRLSAPVCNGVGALRAFAEDRHDPGEPTVGALASVLTGLRKCDGQPGLATFERLVASCANLAAAPAARTFVAPVAVRARLAVALVGLETRAKRWKGAVTARLLDELVPLRPDLAVLRGEPTPATAGLCHALRLRWRRLLALVAERDGAAGLAELLAAHPETVGSELVVDGAAVAGELAHAADRGRALRLAQAWRHADLAALASGRAASERDSLRLAQLWMVEIGARRAHVNQVDEMGDDDEARKLAKALLRRLRQLGAELTRGLPAGLARETAAAFRLDFVELVGKVGAGEEWCAVAEALLGLLPGDPALLAIAVAGAAATDDRKGRQRLEAAVAAARPARLSAELREPLFQALAEEVPRISGPGLEVLRRLLPEVDWAEARAQIADGVARCCRAVTHELAGELDTDVVDGMGRELELLRPLLAGEPSFEATVLAYRCRFGGTAREREVEAFLAAHRGSLPALSLLGMLQALARVAGGDAHGTLRSQIASAAVARLEPGQCGQWLAFIPALAADLPLDSHAALRRTLRRERRAARPGPERFLLQAIERMIGKTPFGAEPRSVQGRQGGRRRPAGGQLGLFGDEL